MNQYRTLCLILLTATMVSGLGEWGEWSPCSRSCGVGVHSRRRVLGAPTQLLLCNTQPCPIGTWTAWESWGSCSRSCDGGLQRRSRRCVGPGACLGLDFLQRGCSPISCTILAPSWGQWTGWFPCNATCGQGSQKRIRFCPGIAGKGCSGDSEETQNCTTRPCPGTWAEWGAWAVCTKSCSGGFSRRLRPCNGSSFCVGQDREQRLCNYIPCPQRIWSQWSPWESCSSSCDAGRQLRHRHCPAGAECTFGVTAESRPCTLRPCESSLWTSWEPWSACSATCGPGRHIRSRACGPGVLCPQGATRQEKPCVCEEAAQWASWGPWSACVGGCDGLRRRARLCLHATRFHGACVGGLAASVGEAPCPCGRRKRRAHFGPRASLVSYGGKTFPTARWLTNGLLRFPPNPVFLPAGKPEPPSPCACPAPIFS